MLPHLLHLLLLAPALGLPAPQPSFEDSRANGGAPQGNVVAPRSTSGAAPLLILTPLTPTDGSSACLGPEVATCQAALVNWGAISSRSDIVVPSPALPSSTSSPDTTGELLRFSHQLDTQDNSLEAAAMSLIYTSPTGSSAVITYNKVGGNMYGLVSLAGGSEYKVETMGDMRHVIWARLDERGYGNEVDAMEVLEDAESLEHMRMDELLAEGRTDPSSIVTFTVTVYYTRQFSQSTADPLTFIDQVIAETNQGYVNSGVPIRVRLHCALETSVDDGLGAADTLQKLTNSQASSHLVRQSADVAIILVENYSSNGICGVNWFNSMNSGRTIGTVRKGCALGYYSFGHEMAHGLGLAHDRRVARSSSTQYAFGHVIKRGSYRSIMAYSTAGEKRVNYYSSPTTYYKGLPTGSYMADNARTLTEVRFAAARVGDESISCPSSSSSTYNHHDTTTTTTTTAAPATICRDKYSNCASLAETSCWHSQIKQACPSSCGLCPGTSPVASNTCFNKYSNCGQLFMLGFCSVDRVRANCNKSCGC